mgnify:CR=1 FL=1
MLFSFTAKNQEGEIIEGKFEAENRFAVARELRSRGQIPISVREPGGFAGTSLNLNEFLGRVKIGDQIIFTKNLSGMLKAGLSISRAISVLQKQNKNPTLGKILISLAGEINSGGTLSSGLEKFPKVFSKLFISMVRAGEESGNLSGALSDIGLNLEKSNALSKKVKGALIYPGVIFVAMITIGILMFAFVVPTLAKTFAELEVDLPASTQFIVSLGNFFSNPLILTFIILVLLVLAFMMLFRAKFMARYIDFVTLKTPVLGNIAKELNTARTARTMSSLLLSGVSIVRAIEITQDVVQNVYFKEVLEEAAKAVEKGVSFAEVFKQHNKLYPVMMSEMAEVGGETGKLSDMLLQIAVFYENEIENKTKNLSTIIEPVLMIFIGAAVGFFAISMISPLYSVLNNIK